MDILQAGAFVLMLSLALYGLAVLVDKIGIKLLRPKGSQMMLVLPLCGNGGDTEWQLRYAQSVAKRLGVPLYIAGDDLNAECETIVRTLLDDGIGEWVDGLYDEKMG